MEQLNAVEVPEEMTGLPVFNGTDTPDSFFITGGDLTTATGSIINLDRTVSGEHTIDCYQYAKFDYEVPAIIICGICVLAGLIYCFFGYRFCKAILFLTGFFFASVLIYLILERQKYFSMVVNAGIAVSAGIVFGLAAVIVQYLGIFTTGFISGVFIGLVAVTLWQSFHVAPTIWALVGILIGCGLILASISLKWQRIMIILNTSFLGAALLTSALDYVLDRFALLKRVWKAISDSDRLVNWDAVCWYAWLVLAMWPCLFALGCIVQWYWTSTGHDHKDGWRSCCRGHQPDTEAGDDPCDRNGDRSKNGTARGGRQLSYVCKADDAANGQSAKTATVARHRFASGDNTSRSLSYESKPWRTIYQSRRAHGDVICQSYLESLQRLSSQNHLSPRWGSSLLDTPTLSSDHTRLTALTSASNKTLHCREFGKSPSVM